MASKNNKEEVAEARRSPAAENSLRAAAKDPDEKRRAFNEGQLHRREAELLEAQAQLRRVNVEGLDQVERRELRKIAEHQMGKASEAMRVECLRQEEETKERLGFKFDQKAKEEGQRAAHFSEDEGSEDPHVSDAESEDLRY